MTFKAPDSLAEQIAHHLAERIIRGDLKLGERIQDCLLYTSPSPRDLSTSRMPSSA